MSFIEFAQSIESTDLRAVADHWQDARGSKTMPSWNDIKPSAIARQLPIVWSYNYDPAFDDFVGRLAGDRITQIFGRNVRGVRMAELHPIIDEQLIADAKRVITEPAFFRRVGRVFNQSSKYGRGERIVMPLASDGCHADGIFGATDYKTISNYVPAGDAQRDQISNWFALS